jgi:hypothetical protein
MTPKAYCQDCEAPIYDSEDREFCDLHGCPICGSWKDVDDRVCPNCALSTTEVL